MAFTLDQNGNGGGRTIFCCVLVTHKLPGRQQAPNPAYFTDGTWKPRIAPFGESRLQGLSMAARAWDVGKSKRRAVMARIRIGTSSGTKVSRRPIGLTSRESTWNRYDEEKQMTTTAKPLLGASSKVANWGAINWRTIERQVKRLQMRIAKATREGRWGKVKSLQWLLTHAFSAKLLAVRRVTRNSGRKTPGVDGIVWKTPGRQGDVGRLCSLEARGRW